MSENKKLDSIMRKITSGFTGNPVTDMPYLQKKCAEYKDHELAEEIFIACNRLLNRMFSDSKKILQNDNLDEIARICEQNLDGIQSHIKSGKYDTACQLLKGYLEELELKNIVHEDAQYLYFNFSEYFEEIMYIHMNKPAKRVKRIPVPFGRMYLIYSWLLVELKQIEEARKALLKGLSWNPVNFQLMSEYTETFKMEHNTDEFFRKTLDAYRIAFRSHDVARCLRNIAYYFVENKLYKDAVGTLLLSTNFDEESPMVKQELSYIETVGGIFEDPTAEDMMECSEKYGFWCGADHDVIDIAYNYAHYALEDKDFETARYFAAILSDIVPTEEAREFLKSIPETDKEKNEKDV